MTAAATPRATNAHVVQYEIEYLDDRLSDNDIVTGIAATGTDEAMAEFTRLHADRIYREAKARDPGVMTVTANAAWPD